MSLRQRLHRLMGRGNARQGNERALDSELNSYVDMLADEHQAAGMDAAEARRKALVEVGGMEQVKQAVRDQRSGAGVEMVLRDCAFGMRQILRSPGFTVTVILTLALSIGANTAIFSILNALLLKSLPYPQPERVGTIFWHIEGTQPFDGRSEINGTQWELLRDEVPSLVGAVTSPISSGANLQEGNAAEYVHAGRVSAHYFEVLGIRPILGRSFTEEEDRAQGPNAVIVSNGLWRTTFHSDPGLIGRAIDLKGQPYTVVGILPAGARTPLNADIYTAIRPSRQGEGASTNYGVLVRLRDGATWRQADAELDRAWAGQAQRFVNEFHRGTKVSFYTVPLQKGQTATFRPKALSLMLAAAFILLIACANLAGLTLVRMSRRAAEIATRLALGASSWRVLRQLWIENLLLALLGGAAGIGVALVALRGLLSLLPLDYLPVDGAHINAPVLAFTLAVSLVTSILFGMLPALALKKIDIRSLIASRTIAGVERPHLRRLLIAGEVALTVVLMAASGLLIRSLLHLQTLPPGFNPQGVMTAKASLDDARYVEPAAFDELMRESTGAMERIPGVQGSAVGLSLPYERALNNGWDMATGPLKGQSVMSGFSYVTPGYFNVLQIPLLAGRSFSDADRRGAPLVVIVNRAFARRYFGTLNPVGQPLDRKGTTVVGVVEDVTVAPHFEQTDDPLGSEPMSYIPAAQAPVQMLAVVHAWFQPSWIVRTAGPIDGLTAHMRRALAGVAPGLPFSGFYSMSDLQGETLAMQRVEVALLGAMAGLALLLSSLGIFSLVASMVAQRTREIGIRLALGASLRRVMVEVGASGLRATALGLAAGLVLCAAVLRVMSSVLYGVRPYDALSLGGVVILLALVALCAVLLPTLKILKADPARTLREQ